MVDWLLHIDCEHNKERLGWLLMESTRKFLLWGLLEDDDQEGSPNCIVLDFARMLVVGSVI